MTNAANEHARYAYVEQTKAAALADVTAGMDREQVDLIVAQHASDLGKAARKSLRAAAYAKAGLNSPASYDQDRGHLTRSSRGTWATVIGNRAYALTRAECVARELTPGPGND